MISGATKGEYDDTLTGRIIKYHQRGRREAGDTPVVWFRNSYHEDHKQRVKAELSARVLMPTGILLEPDQYQVGWTTIVLEGTGERTHVIAVMVRSELHATLEPLFMVMAEETNS